MKRYTPSLESVWAEWHRRERLRRWRAEREARGIKPGPKIPDNSEPWLPHPPRSLDDLFYISDQVRKTAETLAVCGLAEAQAISLATPTARPAAAALQNPDPAVRRLATKKLFALIDAGHPYACELIA